MQPQEDVLQKLRRIKLPLLFIKAFVFRLDKIAVEYVRNFMKRVRKKNSAVIIASQNLEDFNIEGIREYTKPLFSIPTHQFLFNAGAIDEKFSVKAPSPRR